MRDAFRYLAVGLMGLGAVLMVGLFTLFPSSKTCVGLYLFGNCIGYYSTTYNGDNFLLGVAFVAAGAVLFIFRGRKGR